MSTRRDLIPARPLNVNATATLPYTVDIWLSHPGDGNDDCLTGDSFATADEARAALHATIQQTEQSIVAHARAYYANWRFVALDGPDIYIVTENPRYDAKRAQREAAESRAESRRERAMQAGMAFGCDGFNDEMGY